MQISAANLTPLSLPAPASRGPVAPDDQFSRSDKTGDSRLGLSWARFGLPAGPELVGSPELQAALQKAGVPELWAEVEPAYRFAQKAHGAQKRDDGTPYYHHCARVMRNLVLDLGVKDPVALKAALLHDTLEDTGVTPAALEQRFGKDVTELVLALTKPERFPGETYDHRDDRYRDNLLNNAPRVAVAIKLADRMDNIDDLHLVPDPPMITRYIRDTHDHYLPMAQTYFPAIAPRLETQLGKVQAWFQAGPNQGRIAPDARTNFPQPHLGSPGSVLPFPGA